MRILVYGAGNIGSLYAGLLKESGQDVSILAREKRLADIREHGIQLENVVTGKETTVRVPAVGRLDTDDDYDLVLVVLPKNHVSEVLPMLAANRQTPSIMFVGNNAAGCRSSKRCPSRDVSCDDREGDQADRPQTLMCVADGSTCGIRFVVNWRLRAGRTPSEVWG